MDKQSSKRGQWIVAGALAFVTVASGAHYALNVRKPQGQSNEDGDRDRPFLGYIPVTCHLTCPVTDYISKETKRKAPFQPLRFSGFPELKESFISGKIGASFILAPMAISLREQGVPLKIVYLGHRDGTALVVHRESGITSVAGLRGKRVAVPNRLSNQYLLLFRALEQNGMAPEDIKFVEIPPPDMPAALHARAVDAITSGEPFMGQAELDGYGRVLYYSKDIWPEFISCVLAVREDVLASHRQEVLELVEGIAKSGKWLDSGLDNRLSAAQFVAKNYYNQNPRLLQHVLSKPIDRVKYTNLTLHRQDFADIERIGKKAGILKGTVSFDAYTDTSLVKDEAGMQAWDWKYR